MLLTWTEKERLRQKISAELAYLAKLKEIEFIHDSRGPYRVAFKSLSSNFHGKAACAIDDLACGLGSFLAFG